MDDDEDTLVLTGELLAMYGFDVTTASSIGQARELLDMDVFEIVLTDLYVGSHDSDESWRGIRMLRAAAGPTPIGLVTASRPPRADIASSGVAFALQKPFSSEDLLEAVSSCLRLPAVPPENEGLLRAYFASIERADWDRLAHLCSEQVVYHVPGSDPTHSRTVHGRASLQAVAMEVFSQFAEPRFAIKTMRPLPDGALVRYDGSWLTASGQRSRLDGAVLFRLADGEIVEIGVRLDLRALRERARTPGEPSPDRGASAARG